MPAAARQRLSETARAVCDTVRCQHATRGECRGRHEVPARSRSIGESPRSATFRWCCSFSAEHGALPNLNIKEQQMCTDLSTFLSRLVPIWISRGEAAQSRLRRSQHGRNGGARCRRRCRRPASERTDLLVPAGTEGQRGQRGREAVARLGEAAARRIAPPNYAPARAIFVF